MWMNVLVSLIFSTLATVLPALVARVITAAGFGFVTYQLGSYSFDAVFSYVKTQILSLDPVTLMYLNLARFDDALGVLFGGFVASMTLKMTASGSIRKFMPTGK